MGMTLEKEKRKSAAAFASPWTVVGAALVMGAVVAIMAVMNISAQKDYVAQILREKGAALIRAFEAGTRTGMMGSFGAGPRIQELLEETAAQDDIFYIVVTDGAGHILADNDRAAIGQSFVTPAEMKELAPDGTAKWRFVSEGSSGRRSFMVYRTFLADKTARSLGPMGGPGGMGGMGGMGRMGRMMAPETSGPKGPPASSGRSSGKGEQRGRRFLCSEECDATGEPLDMTGMDLTIFVGMDVAPFEQARSADLRNTYFASGVLLVLGLGAVASLFWVQNYRTVRRLLRYTAAFADEIVASLPVGLVVADPDGRVAMVNAAAERISGVSEADMLGKPVSELLPASLVETAARIRETGQAETAEIQMDCSFMGSPPTPVGAGVAVARTDEGAVVGDVYILRDLREVRRLEEEVRRREKMAAIGNLAAGAAHEIRNPLSSIKGYAVYFGGKFPEGSEERESAAIMVREADRLNRVISELIEFARASEIRPRPANLGEIAGHSLRLIRPDAAAKGVTVEEVGLADGPDAALDPDRINQALLNLMLNAVQSMDQGGTLRVETGLAADGRAFVSVADQGPGMDAATVSRAFDPYFTTKAKGTGLGLTIVHNIVEAHGGEIRIDSEPGRGSVFTMLLPLTQNTSEAADATANSDR